MNAAAKLGVSALLLTLAMGTASAISVTSNVCVTNLNPAWIQSGPSGPSTGCPSTGPSDPGLPVTYYLPESPSETTPEPVGDWIFNRTFVGAPGYYTLSDSSSPSNGASDYILFGNNGNGVGEVLFYSDPTLPSTLDGYTNRGVLCVEGATGCVGSFVVPTTLGDFILIQPASDGETFFDPFGTGVDSSDQIRFSTIPEPSTLFLSALLLGVLFCGRRWLRA